MSVKNLISRLILEEKFEQAINIIDEELASNPDSISFLKLKTRVLIAAGYVEEAVLLTETAVTKDKESLKLMRCEILAAIGNLEMAEKELTDFYSHNLESLPKDACRLLLEILESQKKYSDAIEIAKKHAEVIENEYIARLKDLHTRHCLTKSTLINALEEAAITEIFCNSEALAREIYCKFFTRPDVYAVQKKFRDGRYGYMPVYDQLTIEHIQEHLKGEKTLGVYLLNKNSMSQLICFDIDYQATKEDEVLPATLLMNEETIEKLNNFAKLLIKIAAESGLKLFPEKSGYKGMHLWAFFSEPVPARLLRCIAKAITEKANIPGEFKIDLFPAQDYLTGKGLGNLVKVPLGIHRKTLGRAILLEPTTLKTIVKPAEYLHSIKPHSNEELQNIVKRLIGDSVPFESENNTADSTDYCKADNKLALKSFPLHLPEKVEAVFAGCPLLYKLLVKIRTGTRLSNEEVHVLAYILKPLGQVGEETFHRLFSTIPGYDPVAGHLKLKNVADCLISCRKVRMRLNSIAGLVNCDCTFHGKEYSYPSPLLYAGLKPELPGSNIWKDQQPVSSYARVNAPVIRSLDKAEGDQQSTEPPQTIH